MFTFRWVQNPAIHIRRSFLVKNFHGFKPLTIFAKNFILNVCQDPKQSLLTIKKVQTLEKREVEIDLMYK